jgi:flagellar motor component MotA
MGKLIDVRSLGAVWPLIGAVAAVAGLLIWVLGKVEERMKSGKADPVEMGK